MTHTGSVTFWMRQLQAGDDEAAQPLWERYFASLAGLAHQRLRGLPSAGQDHEDVALSAFHAFCTGAQQGRFPRLDDRDDLWQVLVMVTARKAINLFKAEQALKRGAGRRLGAAAADPDDLLAQVVGREPTPQFAAQIAEECQRLLAFLGDEQLQQIAVWKMEGHTNAEIAAKIGRSDKSVERKLRLIRELWEQAGVEADAKD